MDGFVGSSGTAYRTSAGNSYRSNSIFTDYDCSVTGNLNVCDSGFSHRVRDIGIYIGSSDVVHSPGCGNLLLRVRTSVSRGWIPTANRSIRLIKKNIRLDRSILQ